MRYSRQRKLAEIGAEGQQKIAESTVLLVGVGGLGCPILQYLVGAGVGKIILADGDDVALHNLQRQVLFTEGDIGQNKASIAKKRMEKLNSQIEIVTHEKFADMDFLSKAMNEVDCVIDGSDNFGTRYLVNDICAYHIMPLIYGSIHRWSGQVGVFNVGSNGNLRDLFPQPPEEFVPTCEQEGVLGPVAGIIGSFMALECLKVLAKLEVSSKFHLYDGLAADWNFINMPNSGNLPLDYKSQNYEFVCDTEDTLKIHKHELQSNESNYYLVDVREDYEIENRQSNVHYIAFGDIVDSELSGLVGEKMVVFQCGRGQRSKAAAKWYSDKFNTKAYYLEE